jgi:HEAT repeat protein
LIDENTVFSLVAKLAGSSDSNARREAARTVGAVARVRADTWLLALATQLSHDSEIVTRANAASGLALLSVARPELENLVSDRLIELLNEDGLLVPLFIMRALEPEQRLPERVVFEIERLSREHPSYRIRRAANNLIQGDGV